MIDITTDLSQQVQRRLREEEVIWFTTVTPGGIPQPNPVWFCWDGAVIIIYSQPGSYRIRTIQKNSMVSLNLQGVDVLGNDVVVIVGEASMKFNYTQVHPEYETKYAKYLPAMDVTIEQLVSKYCVEITIRPTKFRVN